MRQFLTLFSAFALSACASTAPMESFHEIAARNNGVSIDLLMADSTPPNGFGDAVAVLQGMSPTPSRDKVDFAVAQRIELAIDPALPEPILALQSHDQNTVIMRDLTGRYSDASRRQGIMRRMMEEELQHAVDTDLFYAAMPGVVENDPEEIVASMMLEAHARASISNAFAEQLAQGGEAAFYLESELCNPARLTRFQSPDPATRRAVAREVALGFMSGQGRFYAAFESNRLGADRFRDTLRDAELVRRVYVAAGDMFILPGDTERYMTEQDTLAGLASMINGPGVAIAQGDLWLTKMLPMVIGLSPCRMAAGNAG